MIPSHTIPQHWDTAALITADSDPAQEFETWRQHAFTSPDWQGDEFSLADFRRYIESLRTVKPFTLT